MKNPVTIKPIETPYGGSRFRSRLEARWAVFFDALGLRWDYEPEGFELSDGTRYLPDFHLLHTPQGQRRWVEVKPSHVQRDAKFESFRRALWDGEDDAVLVSGTPLDWLRSGKSFCPRCGFPVSASFDSFHCFPCDVETPDGGGHPTQADGVRGMVWAPHKGVVILQPAESVRWEQVINKAARQAQGARFEHGESGGPGGI